VIIPLEIEYEKSANEKIREETEMFPRRTRVSTLSRSLRKSMPATSLMKGNLCGYVYKVSEKFRVAEPLDRHLLEVL